MLYKSFFTALLAASIVACPVKDAQEAAAKKTADQEDEGNLAQVGAACPCNDADKKQNDGDGNLA